MATNIQDIAPYETIAFFDRIAALIQQTFNVLMEQLIKRSDTLCKELAQLRDEFYSKESARVAAIKELGKTQQEMSLKSNINIPVQEQAVFMFQEAKQKLSAPTPLPNLSFSCPTLSLLQSQIEQFGEVVQLKVPQYSEKKQPILTAGKRGKGEKCLNGCGLSLDEVNETVYIADTHNQRIQVLSFQGEFLSHFGEEALSKPWGISVSDEHIFVTDWGNATLFKFCKNSHQLLNTAGGHGSNEGQLSGPGGLSVDWNGDVFVAEDWNNRVSVFSNLLCYKHSIRQESLSEPRDVKLTTDKVVVLDNSPNCIHFFSRSGDLLTSCVSHGEGQECLVYEPYFFCLDCEQNILVSDCFNHVIKILSNSGELLHTIGSKGNRKGELIEPYGTAISKSGILFVLSDNPNHSLQLF